MGTALSYQDLFEPSTIFLENVGFICSSKMAPVWREILGTLGNRGYNCSWVTLSAGHVGCPMERRVSAIGQHRKCLRLSGCLFNLAVSCSAKSAAFSPNQASLVSPRCQERRGEGAGCEAEVAEHQGLERVQQAAISNRLVGGPVVCPQSAAGICVSSPHCDLQQPRLLPATEYKAMRERLKMLGNMVIPQQAELAAQMLGLGLS
jgi:hypothetical protein